MRIIAGQWRSQKLERPATERTRPVSDRIKESVFNILGHRLATPGALPPMAVADLFAGSGAFGLEALSRGARTACFVERSPRALAALRRNVGHLDCGDRTTVIAADAWRWTWAIDAGPFDLVFLDPPFAQLRAPGGFERVGDLLDRMAANGALRDSALVMLRHDGPDTWDGPRGGWTIADRRTIGRSVISIVRRACGGAIQDGDP